MNSLAVGDLAVGNPTIGFGIAELGLEQSATLLLFLLDVLKDGHWIGSTVPRSPLHPLDRSATLTGPTLLSGYHAFVAVVTKMVSARNRKGAEAPKVEYLCLSLNKSTNVEGLKTVFDLVVYYPLDDLEEVL